ncbi:cytochrome P450 [Streptomyces sp. NPDC047525]|uniref:cytochrome P450 family protein n=1 Tax=Streptomyces sp. NPDC047525 TaxID=3155264 RepID=UPI00340E7515
MLDLTPPQVTLLDPRDLVVAEGRGLRDQGPVVRVRLTGDVEVWATGDHATAREILTHPDFRKNPAHWQAYADGDVPDSWPLLELITLSGMLNADGDDHTRLRKLVGKAFTPRRIEALRPRVEEIVGGLIGDLAAVPGPVDLREAFALPLPMAIICSLFGLDLDKREQLADNFAALHDESRADEAPAAKAGLVSVIGELIAEKTAAPGDDLTSALISAHGDGQGSLSETELTQTLLLFLFAGHETTANLIGNAVVNLAGHPGQLALARESDAWPAVVEETLRRDSPVRTVMFYYAAKDVTLSGTRIKTGEAVVIHVAATGRDPRQFGPTAEEFDILRQAAASHLGFSHGIHYCIGAPLAKMMGTTALRALHGRFDVELVGEPVPVASYSSNAARTLPVLLRNRAPAGTR